MPDARAVEMGTIDRRIARSKNAALSRQASETGRLANAHTRQAEALERIADVLERLVPASTRKDR